MASNSSTRSDIRRRLARLGVGAHRLSPPRPAHNVVPRTRLIDRLDASSARVITVTAGAGYGKSTLLSAWTDTRSETRAWLQVEPADNDPVRLVRSVMCSLQVGLESTSLLDIAAQLQPKLIDRALAALDAELTDVGPFIVVIDDVHLLVDEASFQVLDQLVAVISAHGRVVLSGRSDPPVRTARRLLEGDLEVVRADDLLFTDDESASMFTVIAGSAGEAERSAIAQRVGGWPAGAQFVLLAWRAGDSPRSVVDHTGLSTALLTDYFQQEFMRTLPDADRRFLLDTSVLDRLSGELCDAVLDTSASADRLEALVRSGNAFVIPSGHTGVFRYHPLFSDMLLDELRKSAPDREIELRRRAIEWFDAHGEHNAVVDQALASNGRVDPAPWIFKYIVLLIGRGEIATLARWLGWYAPQDLRTNPLLALASAWNALYTNRPDEAERWIEAAEALSYDGPLPDGTADIPTAVAALRMLAATGGVLQTAADARTVRDAGTGSGPWRGAATLLETVALQLAGKVTDVRPLFEQAEFETRGLPAAHTVALAHLALDSMRRDHDPTDIEIRQAIDEVEDNGLTQFSTVSMVYSAKALADARAGRFETSLRGSHHAEELIKDTLGAARAQIHHRLILADAAIARSDWTTANRLIREASSQLHLEPDATMLHEWADRLAQRCARQTSKRIEINLTPAEQRVLQQLATHFTLGEIAEHLYVSRNTVKTHTVSIYRKLGVSGRSEAIECATELGLLDGGLDERAVVTAR